MNNSRRGQSLLEVIVGLSIGAILIGAGAFAVSSMLQANFALQKSQSASALNQELMDQVRSFAGANWQNLAVLPKSSSTPYYLVASGSVSVVASGTEGIFDNDPLTGSVGQWKFDESAGTLAYDSTSYGSRGTLANTPTRETGAACVSGGCLGFNGTSQYVSFDPGSPFTFTTNSFSIGLWMRVNDYTALLGERAIINKYGGSYDGWRFEFNDAQLVFRAGDGGTAFDVSGNFPNPISSNGWYHVVIVIDRPAGVVRGYLNGNLSGTIPIGTTTDWDTAAPLFLGRESWSAIYSPSGSFDDVRLYNRAVSADEVKQLFGSNRFTRFFTVENACREVGAQGALTGTVPCAGGSVTDPSAQYIAVYTRWQSGVNTGEVKSSEYLTRWNNVVFHQSDWSGGAGETGVLVEPGNRFVTSTNVDVTSTGTLRVRIY